MRKTAPRTQSRDPLPVVLLGACFAVGSLGCTSSGSSRSASASAAPETTQPKEEAPKTETPSAQVEPAVTTNIAQEKPLNVHFQVANASLFDPESFRWDFGNGRTSKDPQPALKYYTGGTYHVKLTYLALGMKVATMEFSLTLNHPAIVSIDDAGVLPDTDGMGVWLEANVSDEDGEVDASQIRWTLGDGTSLKGARVEHTYERPGSYEVFARVRD